MDKTAIKKYAMWARRELIERVSQRAMMYGITATETGDPFADSVGGRLLTPREKSQRQALIRQVREKGYQQVMEEVAYTWFNRFAALRFMEVNSYLPSHVRVFTNEEGAFKPQLLAEAIHLEMEGLDKNTVFALAGANQTEELFKYLLTVQCNALNSILPGMFQPISDYTELLLPDHLLREGSVIQQMVTTIPEEDWTDQVQIIGWLYQYYNSEKKDEVFKSKAKITKENIPAATQLFTPDWIVHYMVENSLGRLWLEGHPNPALQAQWRYYLPEAAQEPAVEAQLAALRQGYASLKPEDIRAIDPCAGSGHILCVLFDVLVRIYEDYGYTAREAAAKIVECNLWGLDIDDRAAQLSYFAVMMKARQYDRRFFSRKLQPKVYAIRESNDIHPDLVDYFVDGRPGLRRDMDTLLQELHDAKEYGSILTISPVDFDALYARFEEIRTVPHTYQTAVLQELLPLVQVAEALAQQYEVVVTNPPYMGAGNMNSKLGDFIKLNFANYKSDFFSAFVIRCAQMTKQEGYCGFFTPYVWMFIQSYEKIREYLYTKATIETLIQFEYSAFEEATVPVCTFAFRNRPIAGKKGCYFRLTDFRGGMEVQRQKTLEAIANHHCGYYFEQSTDNFSKIPGSPVAYWVSENFMNLFEVSENIGQNANVKIGMGTGNNDLFLKEWWEVELPKIGFNTPSIADADRSQKKHFPYGKGGECRRWYGNQDKVIWYDAAGRQQLNATSGHRENGAGDYYFKKSITWSYNTSGAFNARLMPCGFVFDVNGSSIFPHREDEYSYVLAFLCSTVCRYILSVTNATITTQAGNIRDLPIRYGYTDMVRDLAQLCIADEKIDWDAFETSWDFQRHPLLRPVSKLSDAFAKWSAECDQRFATLKANEEELNRIFIDIYGLQAELTPEVADKDVTVRKADLTRDVKSFISYAVGCMFGRYSLDTPGLAYAGGDWDASKYTTFVPDADNIIPICDDEYFEDDMVGRFVAFVRQVYGEATLEENLQFIASALGGKGQPREVIRNYFLNDFYTDHCKTYQKRPIYWLFDSGKKNGFKALIYMHRYAPDTIARIRTDYVHQQQSRYRTAQSDLEQRIQGATTAQRVKLTKALTALQAQAEELRLYEEKIHHLADQMLAIDLDDGVKHNYEIFQDVLGKIK